MLVCNLISSYILYICLELCYTNQNLKKKVIIFAIRRLKSEEFYYLAAFFRPWPWLGQREQQQLYKPPNSAYSSSGVFPAFLL